MRPGRLDRIVYVGPPDQAGREEILRIRMRGMRVGSEVDIPEIATMVSIQYTIVFPRDLKDVH